MIVRPQVLQQLQGSDQGLSGAEAQSRLEQLGRNELDALKGQLTLKARALRDGQWDEVDAAGLVRGGVVRLRLGDIISADAQLIEGECLSVRL